MCLFFAGHCTHLPLKLARCHTHLHPLSLPRNMKVQLSTPYTDHECLNTLLYRQMIVSCQLPIIVSAVVQSANQFASYNPSPSVTATVQHTSSKHIAKFQVSYSQPNNWRFVKLWQQWIWNRQFVSQLAEYFCFLTASTTCSISRFLLPLLWIPVNSNLTSWWLYDGVITMLLHSMKFSFQPLVQFNIHRTLKTLGSLDAFVSIKYYSQKA